MKYIFRRLIFIIPAILWHGLDNQFHSWFKALITLDPGRSIIDCELVSPKILRAPWEYFVSHTSSIVNPNDTKWDCQQIALVGEISFLALKIATLLGGLLYSQA